MKIRYLGTAAAEGIPAIFCGCDNCRKARALGGINIRTRSQSIIDDTLLIDWPADAYMHMIQNGIDYASIRSLLITHIHGDHYYPEDLMLKRKGFAHVDGLPQLTVYGSEDLLPLFEKIETFQKNEPEDSPNRIRLSVVKPFAAFVADGYNVTALPAYHGTDHPYFYMIEKNGKRMLYAHDTDVFFEEVWDYFKKEKFVFDLVSMDCTECNRHISYHGHMCIERNVETRDRMLEIGAATSSTVFVLNHFSHNGRDSVYEDTKKVAEQYGFISSYDGMEIEFLIYETRNAIFQSSDAVSGKRNMAFFI